MTEEIMNAISSQTFGVWFLIGAALVFWMQAGFAMVETGFTRAKNAGNILMKNLMDFCIGPPVEAFPGWNNLRGGTVGAATCSARRISENPGAKQPSHGGGLLCVTSGQAFCTYFNVHFLSDVCDGRTDLPCLRTDRNCEKLQIFLRSGVIKAAENHLQKKWNPENYFISALSL